jgi:hypothetical protein
MLSTGIANPALDSLGTIYSDNPANSARRLLWVVVELTGLLGQIPHASCTIYDFPKSRQVNRIAVGSVQASEDRRRDKLALSCISPR